MDTQDSYNKGPPCHKVLEGKQLCMFSNKVLDSLIFMEYRYFIHNPETVLDFP